MEEKNGGIAMTRGELIVRTTFTAYHSNDLGAVKERFAGLIDWLLDTTKSPITPAEESDKAALAEQTRLLHKAIECIEEGCMWATKAASTSHGI